MNKRNMVVSIIGRPNVGKSTIFNSLMKRQNLAITHNRPGVTRDRHYGLAKINENPNIEEQEIILVDTGGFYPEKEMTKEEDTSFFNIMAGHAKLAIKESDLILFVVDVREGVIPFDQLIIDYIRNENKDFWVLVNKFDTEKQRGDESEFYSLGIDDFLTISASHNLGITTILERLQAKSLDFSFKSSDSLFLQKGVTPRSEVISKVALIGSPNAGKSTLLNQLVGEERALVSPIAGTTVDPIEGFFDLYFGKKVKLLKNNKKAKNFFKNQSLLFDEYEKFQKNNQDFFEKMETVYEAEEEDEAFLVDTKKIDIEKTELDEEIIDEQEYWKSIHLVDTAGIRKRSVVSGFLEEQSVYRSLRAITECDIVVYLADATKGISHQDRRLLDVALEKGKSIIICLNKYDLLKDEITNQFEKKEWLEDIKYDLPWLTYCDVITISAKYRKGLKNLMKTLVKTILIRNTIIPTSKLNKVFFELLERNPVMVARSGGKRLKIKYATNLKADPPTFLLYTNKTKGIPEHYKRYLKNGLRSNFNLDNSPIHLILRKGSDLEKRIKKVRSIEGVDSPIFVK